MSAVGPVKVDVKAEKSCNNWSCCFSWICCSKKRVVAPVQSDSPVSMESIEKITTVYERHHRHHTPEKVQRTIVRSPGFDDLRSDEAKENTKG